MRRFPVVVTALLAMLMVVVSGALLAPTASAAPYCGIRWGSLEKEPRPDAYIGYGENVSLVNVRAGRHACFDRLVLDFTGGSMNAYSVRYVDVVTSQAKGDVIGLRGGARLEIITFGKSAFKPGNPREVVPVRGWRTFRQVADAGWFEGVTELGLGVRARLPFRVFTLEGPGSGSRLVVDVAHRW